MNPQIILAVIIGLVAGALFVWLLNRGTRGDADQAQEKLDRLQKEFDSYRSEVNAHFAQTADAVDQLTQSYQNVFSHLSDGAQKLMDKESLKAQLEKRQGKAVTLAYLVDESGEKSPTAVPAQSVVAQEAAKSEAPAAQNMAQSIPAARAGSAPNPAAAAPAGQSSGSTLNFASEPGKSDQVQQAQKTDDNGSRVLNYAVSAPPAAAPPAAAEENKAGAPKKPDHPASAEAPKKRSVEIAAENAGLQLSHKEGDIGAGETSLEAVKRHLREQNPPTS